MSYHQSFIQVAEDGSSATQVFSTAEPDEVAEVEEQLEGEKSLKSHTKPELVDLAKSLGVPEQVAENLTKAELVEAIDRMTSSDD